MTQENNTQPVIVQTPANNRQTINTITTAVLALAVLAFAAFLFKEGQGAVGGTLAGAVVAHYFTAAHGQATTNSTLATVAAVGGSDGGPAGRSMPRDPRKPVAPAWRTLPST